MRIRDIRLSLQTEFPQSILPALDSHIGKFPRLEVNFYVVDVVHEVDVARWGAIRAATEIIARVRAGKDTLWTTGWGQDKALEMLDEVLPIGYHRLPQKNAEDLKRLRERSLTLRKQLGPYQTWLIVAGTKSL